MLLNRAPSCIHVVCKLKINAGFVIVFFFFSSDQLDLSCLILQELSFVLKSQVFLASECYLHLNLDLVKTENLSMQRLNENGRQRTPE